MLPAAIRRGVSAGAEDQRSTFVQVFLRSHIHWQVWCVY
jgi:hypothetical protein